jgi:hypothetical protein
LRGHPEYDEIHPDDLKSLAEFKKSLGMKRVDSSCLAEEDITVDTAGSATASTPSPASTRRTGGSTVASRRSRTSVQSGLSPVYETSDDEGTPRTSTSKKRRRLNSSHSVASSVRGDHSIQSSITKSTYNNQGTLEEGSGEESE